MTTMEEVQVGEVGTVSFDYPLHISGLWIGEAVPARRFEEDTPVNPIKWSLSILTNKAVEEVSVFGAGYFDDAADIPNQPVIFYTLRGKLQQNEDNEFEAHFDKIYETSLIGEDMRVRYRGKLKKGDDGQPYMTGTWKNNLEGTFGTFVARLEEMDLTGF